MSFFPIGKETGITLFGILGAIGFGVLVFALLSTPSKWDGAVAIRICCDGTPVLRRADGSVWARRDGFTSYRAEDPERICR